MNTTMGVVLSNRARSFLSQAIWSGPTSGLARDTLSSPIGGRRDGQLRRLVDHLDGTLERLVPRRSGGVESYVEVTELNEREGRDPLAVLRSPEVGHLCGFTADSHGRRHG